MSKGKYKKTDDHKKKLSIAKKGKSYEEIYGKERAIEEREKRRLAHLNKKYPINKYPNKGMRNKKWGHHTQESKIKISAFQQGVNVKDWDNFKLSYNRFLKNTARYQIWRNTVFLRDNFTCQNLNCEFCKNEQGIYLQVHHIKSLSLYPELAFKPENGITYCTGYHLKSGLHKGINKCIVQKEVQNL